MAHNTVRFTGRVSLAPPCTSTPPHRELWRLRWVVEGSLPLSMATHIKATLKRGTTILSSMGHAPPSLGILGRQTQRSMGSLSSTLAPAQRMEHTLSSIMCSLLQPGGLLGQGSSLPTTHPSPETHGSGGLSTLGHRVVPLPPPLLLHLLGGDRPIKGPPPIPLGALLDQAPPAVGRQGVPPRLTRSWRPPTSMPTLPRGAAP